MNSLSVFFFFFFFSFACLFVFFSKIFAILLYVALVI